MNTMKTMMPLMATGEGIWEGEYLYVDPLGNLLDRHRSRLYCMYPDEEPELYRQKNVYTWGNGRELSLSFEFRMQESGRLRYQTPRVTGEVWEEPLIGGYPTIRLTWQRTAHPGDYAQDLPNARVHEIIQQLPEQNHRARVWQWFVDDRLVQRTLITETRVSKHWR